MSSVYFLRINTFLLIYVSTAETNMTLTTTSSPQLSATLTKTDIWIFVYVFAVTVCSLIFIFQILGIFYNASRLASEGRQDHATKHGAVWLVLLPLFTTYTMSIAGISTAIHRLHDATQPLCDYTYVLSFVFYASIKIANYFFFLQRAKLAQGMKPIFKDIVFDKYLPIILISLWIIYMLCISLFPIKGKAVVSPRTGRELCRWEPPNTLQYIGVITQTIMDIAWTLFFLYLFGKPMIEVQRRTTKMQKHPNAKQRKKTTADKKLDRTIVINFVASALCSFHTSFCALTFPLRSIFSWVAWWSVLDYAVSSISLFLMLASNRRFLVHMLCCSRQCAERWLKPDTFLSKEELSSRFEHRDSSRMSNKAAIKLRTPSASNILNAMPMPSKSSVQSTPPPPIREHKLTDDFYDITFCRNICIARKDRQSHAITRSEWMAYLDGNYCYYKAKLLWTWMYYSFCCCHCYALWVYLLPKRLIDPVIAKKRQKTINRLFQSAEKLVTQKFYIGLDLEVNSRNALSDDTKGKRVPPSVLIECSTALAENVEIDNHERMATPQSPTPTGDCGEPIRPPIPLHISSCASTAPVMSSETRNAPATPLSGLTTPLSAPTTPIDNVLIEDAMMEQTQ